MARNGFRKQTMSMRGVSIDMDAMRAANEQVVAVGNANMNARGDLLGKGGQIEVRREQIARDYYKNNPEAATQVSLKPAIPDVFETPSEAMARLTSKSTHEIDVPAEVTPRRGARKLVNKSDD